MVRLDGECLAIFLCVFIFSPSLCWEMARQNIVKPQTTNQLLILLSKINTELINVSDSVHVYPVNRTILYMTVPSRS